MPNASNDESGAEVSGIWSRGTADMDESPYLILTGWDGRCPFVGSGWMMRPSMAAHMRIFRESPGMMQEQSEWNSNPAEQHHSKHAEKESDAGNRAIPRS
jgi:hypothetical protein